MRVAVVGSGVAGLGATWLLNEHSDHEVHLYEAGSRLGGHANTVQYVPAGKAEVDAIPVDTGFIVLNPTTYPNFLRFLRRKDVPILETDMTFSVSRDKGKFEWAGGSLQKVFCQTARILDGSMWRLIYDVVRFNACARRIITDSQADSSLSIGRYLEENNYSASFRDNYLIPMTAAVWSTSPDKCSLDFPARTLIQFMHNHQLLQLTGKPSWLTISGGSRVYVEKIISGLPSNQLHASTPVVAVKTVKGSSHTVQVKTANGQIGTYDHVILCCHSDAALKILRSGGDVTQDEERILSKFKWNKNEAVLHSDITLMPKRRLAWSCWNYLSSSTTDKNGQRKANIDEVSLTYWMNGLQHIPEDKNGPVLVTLNPPFEPRKDTVSGRWAYDHPVLDRDAVVAQDEMSKIQNTRGISYAGAYLRYGFHEDGFTAGLRAAADHLGANSPFKIDDADRKPTRPWAAYVFDLLEISGARVLIGFFSSIILLILRGVFGLFVDLSELDS